MLNALLFMNGFALVIGCLVVFMDRVISNYGVCRVTINDDKEFQGQGGKTLLRMMLESKYFIPSACGGKGTCGYCKLKVVEGGGDPSPTEALILTARERREGYRLSCQLKVKNDLKVMVPPEYLEIQEYVAEIALSDLVTSDIKRVRIKLLSPPTISYKPGQYVQIRIDHDGETDFRAYSLASCPDEKGEVEVNVKKIPEGLGSGFIHTKNVGDRLDFSGPYGDFFLRTDSRRTIVCVAGGVGLAPLKSIVLYWRQHQPERRLELYYGVRTTADLYDHALFLALQAEQENFHYYPALSAPDKDWTGDTGFIHTVIATHLSADVPAEGYLCGPPIMIDAVMAVLKAKGIPAERIWYDKF